MLDLRRSPCRVLLLYVAQHGLVVPGECQPLLDKVYSVYCMCLSVVVVVGYAVVGMVCRSKVLLVAHLYSCSSAGWRDLLQVCWSLYRCWSSLCSPADTCCEGEVKWIFPIG
jgi:hypothetical protein